MIGRTLLLGGSGQVGTALRAVLDEVIAPSRSEVDLETTGFDGLKRLVEETRPDVIVNCAAYTAVDRAEDEPSLADTVNGRAVGTLAEVAARAGVPLVTYSTDYVFDGAASGPYLESSPTNPVNAYGRSKLLGEELALSSNPRALVIRTSWVISRTHPNFVSTMLRLAREGREIKVVDDQRGCPTLADHLAAATVQAVARDASGLLHITNQGETTWFELALAAITDAGLDPTLISPCSTSEYPTKAVRPAYSVLGSERTGALGLPALPQWRDALNSILG
jgi:dTDP-4-dehydrorhamnose reductase